MHEAIRRHSVEATKAIKREGADNDLLDRIANDPVFHLSKEEISGIVDVNAFTGRAEKQVEEYLADVVDPMPERNAEATGKVGEVTV